MTGYSELRAGKLASKVPTPFGPLQRTGLGSKFALKLELLHQQVFNFLRYCFDLSQGLVKPKHERPHTLTHKIQTHGARDLLRQIMPLIGLLIATEKQVVLGILHMRPLK